MLEQIEQAPNVTIVRDVEPSEAAPRFSVCTLVSSWEKYATALSSFQARGFTEENTEFFAFDNTERNRFDGYNVLRTAYGKCKGQYILLVHDDVELVEDDADTLLRVLSELEERDPRWMLAGNCGAPDGFKDWRDLVRHLVDPHGESRMAGGAQKVQSVDENFMIFHRERMVLPSIDLSGFHLYGADLGLHAKLLGGTCYVVPFFLKHHSAGNAQSSMFDEAKRQFETKYQRLLRSMAVQTPSGRFYLGAMGELIRLRDRAEQWARARFFSTGKATGARA